MPVVVAPAPRKPARAIPAHLPFVEQLFFLGRPVNAVLPSVLVCAGYYTAVGGAQSPDMSLYALLVSMLLIHLGFTVLNDIADRAVDRDNNVHTIITHGTKRQVASLGMGAGGMIGIGLMIALALSPMVAVCAVIIALLSASYNHAPLRLSRRPVASIVVLGILYGFLPLLAGYFLVTERLGLDVLFLGGLWMLGRMSLSLLKDFKDSDGDKLHYKQTFLLKYGPRLTLQLSVMLGIVAYVGIAALLINMLVETAIFLPMLAAVSFTVLGYVFVKRRLALLRSGDDTDATFDDLIQLQLYVDGLFLIWLIIL